MTGGVGSATGNNQRAGNVNGRNVNGGNLDNAAGNGLQNGDNQGVRANPSPRRRNLLGHPGVVADYLRPLEVNIRSSYWPGRQTASQATSWATEKIADFTPENVKNHLVNLGNAIKDGINQGAEAASGMIPDAVKSTAAQAKSKLSSAATKAQTQVRARTGIELGVPPLGGGLTHKETITAIYERLTEIGPALDRMSWGNQQKFLENFAKEITELEHLTPKEKNYFLVANIMRNKEIMGNAAQFFVDIAGRYGRSTDMNRVAKMRHVWPSLDTDQAGNLKPGSNTGERGVTHMLTDTYVTNKVQKETIAQGLNRFGGKMEELAGKLTAGEDVSLEDKAFILRGVAMLRDVLTRNSVREKTEENIETEGLNRRIADAQHIASREENKRNRFANGVADQEIYRHRDASFDGELQNNPVQQAIRDRTTGDELHLDYGNGTSDTTLHFSNFCMSETKNDRVLSMQLMQSLFAAWHYVQPDGYFHSASESYNVLLENLYKIHTVSPTMVPFTKEHELTEAQGTDHVNLPYAVDFASGEYGNPILSRESQ